MPTFKLDVETVRHQATARKFLDDQTTEILEDLNLDPRDSEEWEVPIRMLMIFQAWQKANARKVPLPKHQDPSSCPMPAEDESKGLAFNLKASIALRKVKKADSENTFSHDQQIALAVMFVRLSGSQNG